MPAHLAYPRVGDSYELRGYTSRVEEVHPAHVVVSGRAPDGSPWRGKVSLFYFRDVRAAWDLVERGKA